MSDYVDEMIENAIAIPFDQMRGDPDLARYRDVFTDPVWQQTEYHTPRDDKRVRLTDMNPSWRGNAIRLWQRRCSTMAGRRELLTLPLVKKMIELGAEGFDNNGEPNVTNK